MSEEFDNSMQPVGVAADWRTPAVNADEAAHTIPVLVSQLYKEAPAPLRTKLLECLLRPVGPLAIVTIATGAFAHLLYRLRLNGIPVSLDDADRINAEHVFELARYVVQSSPYVLQQIGSLVADRPIGVATVSGTALLMALSAWKRPLPANASK